MPAPSRLTGVVTGRRFTGAVAYFSVETSSGLAFEIAGTPAAAREGDTVGIEAVGRGPPSLPGGRMTNARRAGWLGWLLVAVLVWLVAYPLALVLVEGVRGLGGVDARRGAPLCWPLHRVAGALGRRSGSRRPAWCWPAPSACRSPSSSSGSTSPGASSSGTLVALPAVLPPLVGVVAFLFLYGETGFVGRFVQYLFGLENPPWRLAGPGAILLVHAYSMYVYFYLFCRGRPVPAGRRRCSRPRPRSARGAGGRSCA